MLDSYTLLLILLLIILDTALEALLDVVPAYISSLISFPASLSRVGRICHASSVLGSLRFLPRQAFLLPAFKTQLWCLLPWEVFLDS